MKTLRFLLWPIQSLEHYFYAQTFVAFETNVRFAGEKNVKTDIFYFWLLRNLSSTEQSYGLSICLNLLETHIIELFLCALNWMEISYIPFNDLKIFSILLFCQFWKKQCSSQKLKIK